MLLNVLQSSIYSKAIGWIGIATVCIDIFFFPTKFSQTNCFLQSIQYKVFLSSPVWLLTIILYPLWITSFKRLPCFFDSLYLKLQFDFKYITTYDI